MLEQKIYILTRMTDFKKLQTGVNKLMEDVVGIDLEGLEVARECSKEVFKVDSLPSDDVVVDL